MLVWVLIAACTAAAQPSFFKQYQSDRFFFWSGLAAASDGASMTALATSFDAMFLSKMDADGEIIWSKGFRDMNPGYGFLFNGDIAGLADGGFAVAVTQTDGTAVAQNLLMKVGAGGDFLWARRIPGQATVENFGVDASGNDILLSTSSRNSGFYLARFDGQGQLRWAKLYKAEGYGEYVFCNAVFTPDGRILLRGSISPEANVSDDVDYIRMEITADSGMVVNALFSDSIRTGCIAFDGQGNRYESIVSDEGARYAKYAPDGQPAWCKRVAGVPAADYFRLSPGFLNIVSNQATEAESNVLRLDQADGGLVWSKVYTGANYAPFFNNINLAARPQNGLAWLAITDGTPAMAIAQVDAQGEVAGCITHSPCNVSVEDAPFPQYSPINWTEEDYPGYEPVVLLEELFNLSGAPYCDEPWFSAAFTATSPVCAGDTVQVGQQNPGFAVSSEWAFEGAGPANSTRPADTVRYETPGSFIIRHIAEAFGCRDTAYAEVTVRESPVFTLGPDTALCPGNTLLINSGLQPGQYQLEWQDGTDLSTLEAKEPGAYILTASSAAGCSRSDTLVLSYYSLPAVDLGPDTTLCGAAPLEIIPQTDAAQPVYQWNTAAVAPRLTASADGLYALTITDAATGCAGQDSIRIAFAPPLLLRQLPDTSVCPGRPILLEIQSLADTPLSVVWEDGTTDNPYLIEAPGNYTVQVTDGACDTLLNISIPPGNCRPGIFLPNAFSPNGDGRNDFLQAFGPDAVLARLQVFSRWGSLLYDGQGPAARWDGTAFGRPAPAGTYVYKVEYHIHILPGDEVKVASGEVVLVR